jgi:purine-nucleoside phosphorylase
MSAPVELLARSLREHDLAGARIAFVLGSGLGAFAERLQRARAVPSADIDSLPRSGGGGEEGGVGEGGSRVHLYEGWSAEEVTRTVRAFAAIGVQTLVLTNAAGGIRERFRPGTLMRIADHLDLQGRTRLAPEKRGFGSPWDAEAGLALETAARAAGVALESGVYAGLCGPAYETPAEIRWLRAIGADAVGMSTIAEALAAHAAGLHVAGVSCITNLAAGLSAAPPAHAEVLEAGQRAAGAFCRLLEHAVQPLMHR